MNFLKGTIEKNEAYLFVPQSGNCKINLGKEVPSTIENYIGKPLQEKGIQFDAGKLIFIDETTQNIIQLT